MVWIKANYHAQKQLPVQRILSRAASHAKKGEAQQAYWLYKSILDKFPTNAQALTRDCRFK